MNGWDMADFELNLSDDTSYPGNGLPWENNRLGITEEVPAPWEAIRLAGSRAEVWGRAFEVGRGPLPRQIVTQGLEVFAAAPTLDLVVDGEAVAWGPMRATGQREAVVAWRCEADCVGAKVWATVELEYDGLWLVTLHIEPGQGASARIDRLGVHLPLRGEVAQTFSRYLDYDYLDQVTDRDDMADSYGGLDRPVSMGFNPVVWVGDRRGGVEWVCESDEGWSYSPDHAERVIGFRPAEDVVQMTVDVVSAPSEVDGAWRLQFGLYPTPVKPLPGGWRGLRLISDASLHGEYDPQDWTARETDATRPTWGRLDPERLKVYGIVWPAETPLKFPGLPIVEASDSPMLRDPDLPPRVRIDDAAGKLAREREQMASAGVRFIPYGALNFMPGRLPRGEWAHYAKWWRTHPEDFDQENRGSTEYETGRPFRGGGTNPTWRRALNLPDDGETLSIIHVSPAHKSFRDFIVWHYVQAIEQSDIQGIYFDGGAPNVMAVNPALPHGKHVQSGGSAYPFLAQRRLLQRLWVACKSRKSEFLITGHNPKLPAIVSGFYDLTLTGEALTSSFQQEGWSTPKSREDPSLYEPDYAVFPDRLFSVGYAHRALGSINTLLPMIIKNNADLLRADPARLERLTRTLMARTLVYDIPLYPLRLDLEVYAKANRGLSAMGWVMDAEYIPPAESEPLVAADAELQTAVYLDSARGRAMLVVANLTRREIEADLCLALAEWRKRGVDWPGTPRVTDAMEGVDCDPPGGDGETLRLPVGVSANDFRLLILEPRE